MRHRDGAWRIGGSYTLLQSFDIENSKGCVLANVAAPAIAHLLS